MGGTALVLHRLRAILRPPRRLHFTRSGWAVTLGSVVLGFAAIGTGNNLLFLLLGAVLGFIVLSGWLSEQSLRGLEVQRRSPVRATVGEPARIAYEVRNSKSRLPSLAVELGEGAASEGSGPAVWMPVLAASAQTVVRAERIWDKRGVYPLARIVLATSFPFGFFRKERDVEIAGEARVRPRIDRPVRDPLPTGRRAPRSGLAPAGAGQGRGEYRALREYRPGDDPRDVHWRTTARVGAPVVRVYERERTRALWLCLELRTAPGDDAEVAAEITAALAARAMRSGEVFGLATADGRVDPGSGPAQLERVLDVLAGVRFRVEAPRLSPPAHPAECVLVSASGGGAEWGDVFRSGGGER